MQLCRALQMLFTLDAAAALQCHAAKHGQHKQFR
jgi:hypothetical protein